MKQNSLIVLGNTCGLSGLLYPASLAENYLGVSQYKAMATTETDFRIFVADPVSLRHSVA